MLNGTIYGAELLRTPDLQQLRARRSVKGICAFLGAGRSAYYKMVLRSSPRLERYRAIAQLLCRAHTIWMIVMRLIFGTVSLAFDQRYIYICNTTLYIRWQIV